MYRIAEFLGQCLGELLFQIVFFLLLACLLAILVTPIAFLIGLAKHRSFIAATLTARRAATSVFMGVLNHA